MRVENGIFSIQFQGIVERDISAIRREAEAEELRADLNKLKVSGVLGKKRE